MRKYIGIKRIASLNESARLNNKRYTRLSMKTSILEDLISKHGGKASKLGEAFGIKGFHRIDKDNNISELYIQSKNANRKNVISLAKESSASITEIYGIVQFNGDEPEANGVYNDNPTFTYTDQRSYQDDETGIRPMNAKKDDSDNVERDMVTDEPKSEEDFEKKEESPKKKETEETSDSEDEETEEDEEDTDDEEDSDSEEEEEDEEEENSDDSSEEEDSEEASDEEDTDNEEEISDKDSEDEEIDNGENSSNEEENSDDDFGDDSEEESDSEEVADDDFGDDSDEDTEPDDDFDDDDFDSEDENPNENEEDTPEEEEIDSGEEKDENNEEQESADESKKLKKKKFGNRLLSSTEVGAVSGFQVGAVDRILPVSDHLPYPPAGIVPRVMNPRKRKIQIIDGRIK